MSPTFNFCIKYGLDIMFIIQNHYRMNKTLDFNNYL